MRMKYPLPGWAQWIVSIITYLQFSLTSCEIVLPSSYYPIMPNSSVWKYLNAILSLNMWIFAGDTYLVFGIFVILACIIAVIVLFQGAYHVNQNNHLNKFYGGFIRGFQQIFVPILTIPVFYRLSSIIEYLCNNSHSISGWISLAIYIISILFFCAFNYLTSTFLSPLIFIPETRLQKYDSRYETIFYFAKLFFCVMMNIYPMFKRDDSMFVVALIPQLIGIVFLFYICAFNTMYIGFSGAFFNLAPFFAIPVVTILYNTSNFDWEVYVLTTILTQLVFCVVCYVIHQNKQKESLKIFRPYFTEAPGEIEIPSVIFGNLQSTVRDLITLTGNPYPLILYLRTHGGKTRNSIVIEICKFLAVFPSQRKFVLETLSNLKSKSLHNNFMIFVMRQVLTWENNFNELESMSLVYHCSFLIHSNLFWNARMKRNRFEMMKHLLQASDNYIKAMDELHFLLNRFPNCASTHLLYSEIMMTTVGNYEEARKHKMIAEEIVNQPTCIPTDNILPRYSLFNPMVLLYLEKSEHECMNQSKRNSQLIGYESSSLITSKINKKNYCISILFPLNMLIFILAIGGFILSSSPYYLTLLNAVNSVHNIADNFSTNYPTTASAIFMNSYQYNAMSEEACLAGLNRIPAILYSTYYKISETRQFANEMTELYTEFLKYLFPHLTNYCNALVEYKTFWTNSTRKLFAMLNLSIDNTMEQLDDAEDILNTTFGIINYIMLVIVAFIIVNVLALGYTYFMSMWIYKDHAEVEAFMSSKRRLATVLMQKGEMAWDLLKEYIPSIMIGSSSQSGEENSSSSERQSKYLKLPTPEQKLVVYRSQIALKTLKDVVITPEKSAYSDDIVEPAALLQTAGLSISDDDLGSDVPVAIEKDETNIILTITYVPFVIAILVFFSLLQPIGELRNNYEKRISNVRVVTEQSDLILSMMSIMYEMTNFKYPDIERLISVHYELLNGSSPITDLYQKVQCFPCYTVSSVIQGVIDVNGSISVYSMYNEILPKVVNFGYQAIVNYLVESIEAMGSTVPFSVIPIIVWLSIIILMIIIYTIYNSIKFNQAANALFKFPISLLKEGNKQENPFIPSNIIMITTIASTGEIYSITENADVILGISGVDFISKKLDEVFPINGKVREFVTFQNTLKAFDYYDEVVGSMVKTYLVETQKKTNDHFLSILADYLPAYFAKTFLEKGIRYFDFSGSCMLLIRVREDLPPNIYDKFYNIINTHTQNYSTIRLLQMGSGITVFTILPDAPQSMLAFFLRDILVETQSVSKRFKSPVPLVNAMVDFKEHLSVELYTQMPSEVFLKVNYDDYFETKSRMYSLDDDSFIISKLALLKMPEFKKFMKSIIVDGIEYSTISFSNFYTMLLNVV